MMSATKAFHAVVDELYTLLGELEADGHKLAASIRAHFEELLTIVKNDAAQVARDAEAAAAPVVAEAEADAKQIAKDAFRAVIPQQRKPA
jgi:hypothetical protein